jgi:uncharacterized protein
MSVIAHDGHPSAGWDLVRQGRPHTSRDPSFRRGDGMWVGILVAVLALLAILTPVAAPAQTFPKFTNFVVDQADIIPPAIESRLDRELGDLQRRTRHQLAIVTVNSLQGFKVEDYSLRLARTWAVGRKHYDDGVVILVAPNERKVRIEVGYGLEATLTDPRCAVIVHTVMLPAFTNGDYARGIVAGAHAIIARLNTAAPLEMAKR